MNYIAKKRFPNVLPRKNPRITIASNSDTLQFFQSELDQHCLLLYVNRKATPPPEVTLLELCLETILKSLPQSQTNLHYLSYLSVKYVTLIFDQIVSRRMLNENYLKMLVNSSYSNLCLIPYANEPFPAGWLNIISTSKRLTSLDLYRCQIKDQSEVANLKNLVQLMFLRVDIFSENIDNSLLSATFLSCISYLVKLKELHLSKVSPLDINAIVNCMELQTLDVCECELINSDSLNNFTKLENLTISDPPQYSNNLSSHIFLLFPQLVSLKLTNMELNETVFMNYLPSASKLELLDLSFTNINTLSLSPLIVPECCPSLKLIIMLNFSHEKTCLDKNRPGNILLSKDIKEFRLFSRFLENKCQFVTSYCNTDQVMDMLVYHLYHPITGTSIIYSKCSSNAYYLKKGRFGSRAQVSPHFLMVAYMLQLNPTNAEIASIMLGELLIDMSQVDLEVICTPCYVDGLLSIIKYSSNDTNFIQSLTYLKIICKRLPNELETQTYEKIERIFALKESKINTLTEDASSFY